MLLLCFLSSKKQERFKRHSRLVSTGKSSNMRQEASLRMNGRTTGQGKLYLWHADRNNNPKESAINLPLLNLLV